MTRMTAAVLTALALAAPGCAALEQHQEQAEQEAAERQEVMEDRPETEEVLYRGNGSAKSKYEVVVVEIEDAEMRCIHVSGSKHFNGLSCDWEALHLDEPG